MTQHDVSGKSLSRRALLRTAAVAVPAAATVGLWTPPAEAAFWSGYVEVPGNMFTRVSPAAVTYNGDQYLVISGNNARVFVNRFDGNLSFWTGYVELPGRQTGAAPTAVVHNGLLYVFITDTLADGRLYFNRFDGISWTGFIEVPGQGRTSARPAAVSDGTFLYLFYTVFTDRFSNRIHFTRFDGTSWTPQAEVPPARAQTRTGLSASFHNGGINLFHTGLSGSGSRVYLNRLANGFWSGYSEVPSSTVSTADQTSAISHGGSQFLVLRAVSSRIFLSQQGDAFGPFLEVPGNGTTPVGPVVNSFGGNLDLFVGGLGSAAPTRIFRNVFS
jgi:hypothetical protein